MRPSTNIEERVAQEIARTLHLQEYASVSEQVGRRLPRGKTWDDVAPPTPTGAIQSAWRLIGRIEEANGMNFSAITYKAREAQGKNPHKEGLPDEFLKELGYSLAMESLGHGVSWTDKFDPIMIEGGRSLTVPYFEYYDDKLANFSPDMDGPNP